MKLRTFLFSLTLIVAVASCADRVVNRSKKFAGEWYGSNRIENEITNPSGGSVIQELEASFEVEFALDSTFTAKIILGEDSVIKMGCTLDFSNSEIGFKGTTAGKTPLDIVGKMVENPDNTITMTYSGTAPEENFTHKGEVTISRKEK